MKFSIVLRRSLVVAGLAWASLAAAYDPDETFGPTAECPTLSPNGQQLAFVSNASGGDEIWIAFRDGTGARPLISWPASTEGCPDWSPDGRRLVFASNRGGSTINVWSVDANGANAAQLTSGVGDNSQPRFSPDGTRIVFLSNRTGKRELWLMKADGTNQQAVKLLPQRISDPAWSPDGNEIAYVGCADGACNIYAITTDGATSRRITSGAFDDWHPHWSPYGIAFASNRNSVQGLWVIDGTGSNLRSLTTPSGMGDLHPRWESNGTNGVMFSRWGSTEGDSASSNIWLSDATGREVRVTRIVGFFSAGDANTDGKTDCADMSIVRAAFGSRIGQAKYSASADLNGDGIVDVRDLALVSKGLPTGSTCR